MLKEIKYLIFLLLIGFFIFFTGKYYFSDDNKNLLNDTNIICAPSISKLIENPDLKKILWDQIKEKILKK